MPQPLSLPDIATICTITVNANRRTKNGGGLGTRLPHTCTYSNCSPTTPPNIFHCSKVSLVDIPTLETRQLRIPCVLQHRVWISLLGSSSCTPRPNLSGRERIKFHWLLLHSSSLTPYCPSFKTPLPPSSTFLPSLFPLLHSPLPSITPYFLFHLS